MKIDLIFVEFQSASTSNYLLFENDSDFFGGTKSTLAAGLVISLLVTPMS